MQSRLKGHMKRQANLPLVVFLCSMVFLVLGVTLAITQPFNGIRYFDELAHFSYVMQIAERGVLFIDFNDLTLLGSKNLGEFTSIPNYTIHLPFYYGLMALLSGFFGPSPEGIISGLRIVNVLIVAATVALALALSLRMRLDSDSRFIYFLFILTIPTLPLMASVISNSNPALLAGVLCTVGVYRFLASPEDKAAWPMMVAGFIMAALIKLTVAIPCGALIAWAFFSRARWDGTASLMRVPGLFLGLGLCALSLAPYIVIMAKYGSPAPPTDGYLYHQQNSWFRTGEGTETLSFFGVLGEFARSFITYWTAQGRINPASRLGTAIVYGVFLFAGFRALRLWGWRRRDPLVELVIAGGIAFAAELAAHIFQSYRLHVNYGDLIHAYPRYYLSLMAIMAAGVALGVREIGSRKARRAFVICFGTLALLLYPFVYFVIDALI